VNDAEPDALVAAAPDGIECDGLGVEREDEGFRFRTPDGRTAGLAEAELRSHAAEYPWFVSNWYYWRCRDRPEVETAFLRWLEDADDRGVRDRYEALARGVETTWGELAIDVTIGADGDRAYAVRHEADADAVTDTLSVHTDPLDARDLVRYDRRSRYRPLKTALTLRDGWTFVELDGRSLVRTVDVIYPATMTNWYLERQDELDVDHWRDHATTDRHVRHQRDLGPRAGPRTRRVGRRGLL
jgi:hypothetical protein